MTITNLCQAIIISTNYIYFFIQYSIMHAQYLQSCQTLYDPTDAGPPGSFVHGILQARILEWIAISSSRGSSWPRDRTSVFYVSCITGRFFTRWTKGKATPGYFLGPWASVVAARWLSTCGPGTQLPFSVWNLQDQGTNHVPCWQTISYSQHHRGSPKYLNSI